MKRATAIRILCAIASVVHECSYQLQRTWERLHDYIDELEQIESTQNEADDLTDELRAATQNFKADTDDFAETFAKNLLWQTKNATGRCPVWQGYGYNSRRCIHDRNHEGGHKFND